MPSEEVGQKLEQTYNNLYANGCSVEAITDLTDGSMRISMFHRITGEQLKAFLKAGYEIISVGVDGNKDIIVDFK